MFGFKGFKFGKGVEKKSSNTIRCDGSFDIPNAVATLISGGSSGTISGKEALRLYAETTVVSNPVNKVVDSFMDTEFILRRRTESGEEVIKNHEILTFLRSPSPDYDEKLFKACLGLYYLLTGEIPLVTSGMQSGPPLEINPVSPVNLTYQQGSESGFLTSMYISGDSFTGTYYREQSVNAVYFTRDDFTQLIFIRNFSTISNSQLRGQSRLGAASSSIQTYMSGIVHNYAILNNGGTSSMIINIKDELNTRDFKDTKKRITEQVSGLKSGSVMVVDSKDMEIKTTGSTNRDMDFNALMDQIKEITYTLFNVPLTLASTDSATYNNLTTSYEALYDMAVIPLAYRICAGLDPILLPRFGLDPAEYSLSIDLDAIPALRKRRLEELKLRRDVNVETINEYRALLSRDNVLHGDTIQQAATLVTLGESDDDENEPRVMGNGE